MSLPDLVAEALRIGEQARELATEARAEAAQAQTRALIPGERGERGLQGERGDVGIQGPAGERGLQGDRGPVGLQGIEGRMGPAGEKGPRGDPGQRGLTGAPGAAGKPGTGFTWRGEWDEDASYVPNDVVQSKGSSYVALAPSRDVRPPDGEAWDLMAKAGRDGKRGERGAPGVSGGSIISNGGGSSGIGDFVVNIDDLDNPKLVIDIDSLALVTVG